MAASVIAPPHLELLKRERRGGRFPFSLSRGPFQPEISQQVLSTQAAHDAIADRLSALGRDPELLTDAAAATLVLRSGGQSDRLQLLITTTLFLGSMDSAAQIGREYVLRAVEVVEEASGSRLGPVPMGQRDVRHSRPAQVRRPGRSIAGVLAAAVAAACLVVPQREGRRDTVMAVRQVARPPAPGSVHPASGKPPGSVAASPGRGKAAQLAVQGAKRPAPFTASSQGATVLVSPSVADAPSKQAMVAHPIPAPEPSAEAEASPATRTAPPAQTEAVPPDPMQEARIGEPSPSTPTSPASTQENPGLAPQPSAEPDQDKPSPMAVGPGGVGLLMTAQPGDTLPHLYRQVYRGVHPPPYAEFAAANPSVIRPGTLLLFPTPPDGWKQR